MKTVEITLRTRQKETQDKVKRKLSWRDSWRDPKTGLINEIIYEGEGGDIRFFYDPVTRRMVPHIVDVYKKGSRTTYSEIKKFINGLGFEHTIEDDIRDVEVVISFTDRELGNEFYKAVSDIEQFLFGSRFCDFDVKVDYR